MLAPQNLIAGDSLRESASNLDRRVSPPKILLCAVLHWVSTVRLCANLIRQGCDVAVVAPAPHGVHGLRDLGARFICSPHRGTRAAIRRAIERWRPDFVVPADDPCVEILHDLADRHATGPDGWIGRLLVRSMGPRSSFAIARSKPALMELAAQEAIRVPETRVLASEAALHAFCRERGFPAVVKLDGTNGGRGVRIVGGPDAAARAYRALRAARAWPYAAKRAAKHLDFRALLTRWQRPAPALFAQSYIGGRPANRAVLCWEGEVLAGLSVEALQTVGATGPATVVRVLDHPEMTRTAQRIAARLQLSGFIGFDFVLQEDAAVLLEMNPRPTQICHFAFDPASDLVGALFARLAGAPPAAAPQRRRPQGALGDLIALFPGELWRDPGSPHLRSAYHDVPWEAEALIDLYSRPVPAEFPTWVDRLKPRRTPRALPDQNLPFLAEDCLAACPPRFVKLGAEQSE
jgi:glutathione synthase/RimK-type ligase-like ATP-grasp enzyme